MKKSQILALLAAFGLVAGALLLRDSLAQTSAPATLSPARVAVCDIQEVFANYARATDLLAQLNDKRQALTTEDEQRGKALDAIQAELSALKRGSKEYEARLAEAERLRIDRAVAMQYKEGVLRRDHRRLTLEMYEEINKTLAAVAKDKGLDLVLYRDGELVDTDETLELLAQIRTRKVLYSDDRLDITAEVLDRLNAAYRRAAP